MNRGALIATMLLAGCASADEPVEDAPPPVYEGVSTRALDRDLVRVEARMKGVREPADISAYTRCAAALFALSRAHGFARHLRTNVEEKGGVWTADAVYTISPTLPRGSRVIDARVEAATCKENGIPTV